MIKILADTSTQDLFIALIKDDKCIDYILEKNLLKKTDALPVLFSKLLSKHKLVTKNIDEFYCTNGPGSFTGSRSAFIFFKTICMMGKGKLYLSSSLQFLALANKNVSIVIDAKSQMQYLGTFHNKKLIGQIKLVVSNKAISSFHIEDFLSHTSNYLSSFTKVSNILQTQVNYIKEPSIGEIKA